MIAKSVGKTPYLRWYTCTSELSRLSVIAFVSQKSCKLRGRTASVGMCLVKLIITIAFLNSIYSRLMFIRRPEDSHKALKSNKLWQACVCLSVSTLLSGIWLKNTHKYYTEWFSRAKYPWILSLQVAMWWNGLTQWRKAELVCGWIGKMFWVQQFRDNTLEVNYWDD